MYKILELLSLQRNGKPCMSITKGVKRWFLQRHAKSGSCNPTLVCRNQARGLRIRFGMPGRWVWRRGGNFRTAIRWKTYTYTYRISANFFYPISSPFTHKMLARVLTRARPQRNLLTQRFSTTSGPRTTYTHRTTAILAGLASAVRVHLHYTQPADPFLHS